MPNVLFGGLLEIAGSCLKRATIGDTVVSQMRFLLFFSLRWSDLGVPCGPWRAVVQQNVRPELLGASCPRPLPPPVALPPAPIPESPPSPITRYRVPVKPPPQQTLSILVI